MKGKLKKIVLILVAGTLFPYMAVLLAVQNGVMVSGYEADNGRQVILTDGSKMESERYLAGILAKQIGADYPEEALKAQAVLARTWLYQAMGDKNTIREDQLGQYAWDSAWMIDTYGKGYSEYYRIYYSAVFATRGETAWYENERITPLYHTLSAGRTRDDISGSCPYLIGRECNFDMEAEQFLKVQIVEPEDYWAIINQIDPNRQIDAATVTLASMEWNTDQAGYVVSAHINEIEFSAQEIQRVFELPSAWVRVEEYGTQIRLIGRGIGHGYGLSQWEARRLAGNGHDYKQILGHFFHGISIKAE